MIVKPEAYAAIAVEINNLPIFYQPWYLDIVSQGNKWFVIISTGKDKGIEGVWPIIVYKKMGINFAMNPILMPFCGPLLFPYSNINKKQKADSFHKKVLFELIDQLPKDIIPLKIKCNTKIDNWLPFYWKGFSQTTRYTYRLNIKQRDLIPAGYTTKLRNILNKSEVNIVESQDSESTFKLIVNTLNQKSGKALVTKDMFSSIDEALSLQQNRKIFIAKRETGEDIASVYIVLSNKTAYLMFIGSKGLKKADGGVIRQLIHHAILNMPERIEIFDFEGSMIEDIEYIFRSFGGKRSAYHEISRVRSKWLQLLLSIK